MNGRSWIKVFLSSLETEYQQASRALKRNTEQIPEWGILRSIDEFYKAVLGKAQTQWRCTYLVLNRMCIFVPISGPQSARGRRWKWNNLHRLPLWQTELNTDSISLSLRENPFYVCNPLICQNLCTVFYLGTLTRLSFLIKQGEHKQNTWFLFYPAPWQTADSLIPHSSESDFVARETVERPENSWIQFISSVKKRQTPIFYLYAVGPSKKKNATSQQNLHSNKMRVFERCFTEGLFR